jgi:hypothetical protein
MASAGLFIGWGAPIAGREATGLEVFGEALAYYARLEGEGRIESSEVVLLEPHGGDLEGFILVRGSADQMNAVRADDEFRTINAQAGLVVQRLGTVDAVLGDSIETEMGRYAGAIEAIV